MINGNMVGGTAPIKTVKIVDENGNEILGVVTESEVVFTATDNDVREGMVYASNDGVSTGTKNIPAYHTNEGKKIVMPNTTFSISLPVEDAYDFTALQILICAYNTSITNSVAADRIGINESLYPVQSTELLSTITKNTENKTIDLGIINDTKNKFVIRFFTYKECY